MHCGRRGETFLADSTCEGVVVKHAVVQSCDLAPQRVQLRHCCALHIGSGDHAHDHDDNGLYQHY